MPPGTGAYKISGDFTLASQVRLLKQKIVCEDKSQVKLGHVQVKKYANVISCLANHKQKSHPRTEDAYINKFCISDQVV